MALPGRCNTLKFLLIQTYPFAQMARVECNVPARTFSDIALVFNHLLDSFEPELRGKGAFSPTRLSVHHLTFTVLTLTGFRGVLNYRSIVHVAITVIGRLMMPENAGYLCYLISEFIIKLKLYYYIIVVFIWIYTFIKHHLYFIR